MTSTIKLFLLPLGREFFKNSNRFFTIFFLSFLTMLVSLGLFLGSTALGESFRLEYDNLQWMDVEISSPFPLTETDVEALEAWEAVAFAEGAYLEDVSLLLMSGDYAMRAVSLGSDINLLSLAEGRLPQTPNECVVSPDFTVSTGLTVGDTLYLGSDSSSLAVTTFQIVGIGQNPNYLSPVPLPSKLSTVVAQMYLLDTAFLGDYHSIFVTFHQIDTVDIPQGIASISQVQCQIHSQQELLVAEAELQRAEDALTAQELATRAEITVMEEELALLEQQISLAWLEYRENKDILEEIQILEASYQDSLFAIQNKEIQVESLLEGFRRVCEEAQRQVQLLQTGAWSYTTREDNLAYEKFHEDLGYLQRLCLSLPWIFYGIYFVISLFLLCRMVEEERRQIGIYFALGYEKWEVFVKYIAYVTIPTTLGWLIGTICSYTLVPYWILWQWQQNYLLAEYQLQFHISLTLGIGLLLLVTGLLLGTFPCIPLLSTSPLSLLRAKPPVVGKHVWIEKNHLLWSELNFHQKIAVRSLFRHKLRFVVQVTAIGCSCALMLTAFALEESFYQMANLQYDEVYRYNVEIQLEEDSITSELLEIQGVLSLHQLNNAYTLVSCEKVKLGDTMVELYVFQDATSVNQSINLRLGRWRPYNMPENGFVVSWKLAQAQGLALGDELSLQGSLATAEGMVSALCEQYAGMRIYSTQRYMEQISASTLPVNRLFLQLQGSLEELQSSPVLNTLLKLDACQSILLLEEQKNTYTESNNFIEYFLQYFGPFACVLAYFVLYHLCQNALSYRKGELATLKVLGLFDKELSAYVYRENIFYTFFGTCFGLFLGKNLYLYLVKSLESGDLMLYRGVDFSVFLKATGLTVGIALLVNIQAHFQIKYLDVVEEIKLTEQ